MRAFFLSLPLLVACGGKSEDTGGGATAEADGGADDGGGSGCEASASTLSDEPLCAEDYSLCVDVIPPANFSGTPRQLALALYTTVPPAGPPNAILATLDAPALAPCARFPVVVQPMLETGDFYVWANLYMEGGGTFVPVNDIDYTAVTDAAVALTGAPAVVSDLNLSLASGW
jgi:hypothetical protein